MTIGKVCKRCLIKQDVTEFYKFRWVCKSCCVAKAKQRQESHKDSHRTSSAAYYKRNRERCLEYSKARKKANWGSVLVSARASNRNRRLKMMGASIDDFLAALESQGGRCAICQVNQVGADGGKNVHVDHCHKTGKFRGILCAGCNKGLGHFCDEPENLRRAAAYLVRCDDAASEQRNARTRL